MEGDERHEKTVIHAEMKEVSITTCCGRWPSYDKTLKGTISVDLYVYIRGIGSYYWNPQNSLLQDLA